MLSAYQQTLRVLFVLQRLAMLCLHLLLQERRLEAPDQQGDSGFMGSLRTIFFDLHISFATVLQIVLAGMNRHHNPSRISHTFKLIRSMCEVEKLTAAAASLLRGLVREAGLPSLYDA